MIYSLKTFCFLLVLIYCVESSNTNQSNQSRGRNGIHPTIVRGVRADIELFPWLAVITKYNQYHCGGVIVSDRVILSAAHCIFKDGHVEKPEYYSIFLGSTFTTKGAQYEPCALQPHPQYNQLAMYNYYYDMSLILVKTNIRFNKRVQKAIIVPHEKWRSPGNTLIVAGYGRTATDGNSSDTLQMTYMSYMNNAECNSSMTSEGFMPVPNFMFCMIGDRPTSDCYGDSGSGVMWGGYVVGIVTSGRSYECGLETTPSMYTDLAFFRGWIDKSITELHTGVYGC